MQNKTTVLKFREVNRDIFDAIRDGRKKVETRAATEKYRKINRGDVVVLSCGKNRFEKLVAKATVFKTVSAVLKKYKVKQINPNVETEAELRKMWLSFPGYKEKIKKCGLVVVELR